MNNKTEVDVIISCYNHGIYIEETIKSLRCQTIKPDKIIIVNDGSNDKYTLSILKEIETASDIKIINQKKSGPAAARNVGFANSKSEYLLLIDSDDTLDETFIQKAIDILSKYPLIGVVSSWAVCFGYEDYIWYPQGGGLKDFLFSTTCPSAALLRRIAWIDSNGFNENLLIGYEDWDFWIRITKRGWLIYIIPELLYFYLQKKESRVKETFSKHNEIYKIIILEHPDIFKNIYPDFFKNG